MSTSLNDIKSFSICPRYYRYSQKDFNIPARNKSVEVFTKVIQQAYYKVSTFKSYATWNNIINWSNKELFKHVDITDKVSFKAAHKISEYILVSLDKWYPSYMHSYSDYYINVPALDYQKNIKEIIPAISIDDEIKLITVGDTEYSTQDLYNDYYYRGLMYLAGNSIKKTNLTLQYMNIGIQGKFSITQIHQNEDSFIRTKASIYDIIAAINKKTSYPSKDSKCNTCKYKNRCVM